MMSAVLKTAGGHDRGAYVKAQLEALEAVRTARRSAPSQWEAYADARHALKAAAPEAWAEHDAALTRAAHIDEAGGHAAAVRTEAALRRAAPDEYAAYKRAEERLYEKAPQAAEAYADALNAERAARPFSEND